VRVIALLMSIILLVPFVNVAQDTGELNLAIITPHNIEDLVLLEEFSVPEALALAWSDDSEQLIVSSYEGIWLLNLNVMQWQQLNLDEDIVGYDVLFVENSTQIIIRGGSELILFDLNSHETERIISPAGMIRAVNDNGTLYASIESEWNADYDTMLSQTVRIYDVAESSLQLELPVTLYQEFCFYACEVSINFSPDNSQVAFTSAVLEVESVLVDLASGENNPMPQIGYLGTQYSLNSSFVASRLGQPGYIPNSLVLISTDTIEIAAQADFVASSLPEFNSDVFFAIGAYNDNAPNPDEASGFVYFFKISDLEESVQLRRIAELPFARPPTSIAFSYDGRILAVSDGNGKLSLWVVR